MKRRGVVAKLTVGLTVVLAGILVSSCGQSAPIPAPVPTADASVSVAQPIVHTDATKPSAALPAPVHGCQIQDLNLDSKGAGAVFQEPEVIAAVDGAVTVTLTVKYGDNKIADCPVHLRSYNGKLVGPTLRARPGDTLRITLVNTLLPDVEMRHVMNTIGSLNHTNLHTHGLHVSPAGNSDNVLLDIAPGETFEYEIKIPLNQVPGTYWYHAHMHGSTATQVASGMEGALIVMGDQVPNTVDSLPSVKAATEKIFVIQQLIYDETGHLEPDAGGNAPPGVFPTLGNGLPPNQIPYFGPCSWEPMKREHTINGQMFPVLTMAPGEVQRWRLIDAGIRETIGAELHGPYTGNGTPTIDEVLKLPKNNLNEIAVDGTALNKVDVWDQVELEPGYRSDVMVQLSKPGKYFLVDNGVIQTTVTRNPTTGKYRVTRSPSLSLTCPGSPEQPNFLATIVVSGAAMKMSLPTTQEMAGLPLPFQPIVALTTATTAPNPQKTPEPISPYSEEMLVPLEQIDGFQKVDFTVTAHPPFSAALPGPVEFMAADHVFDDQNRRRVTLGNTEEWVLNTQADSLYYAHPFHIHINPFQTMRWGPDGKRELVWKDTILVKQGIPTFIYTRYQDYIGAFVYHCHILDHEDQGMMEIVEVVNP